MMNQDKCYLCGSSEGFSESGSEKIQKARCKCCGATLGESSVAHMLVKYAGGGEACLSDSLQKLADKKILNIDFEGQIHEILKSLDLYVKYDAGKADAKQENYYDFIISEDFFEHASDISSAVDALDEMMAPQGIHIFLTTLGDEVMQGEGKSFVWNIQDCNVVATHKKMSDVAEYSGERFVPGIEDQKLAIEHMQRYKSVAPLVVGKKVLDIACGEGYGTAILAEKAVEVVGVDIDSDAIARATQKYERENSSYQVGNIESIPAEDHSIDVIVSFETIEHVSQKLQQRFLAECERVLKHDGMLIMSTPNKAVYSDQYNYFNEYHVHEFYHDEYLEFLHQKFKNIKMYNQAFQVVSVLSDCENTEHRATYCAGEQYDSAGKYYLAIASNSSLSLPEISSVYLSESGEYEQMVQRILELQLEQERRNIHIKKLDEQIASDGERIVQLQMEEQIRNEHIAKLDGEIAKKDQVIASNSSLSLPEISSVYLSKSGEYEQMVQRILELQLEQERRNIHIKKLDEQIASDGERIAQLQTEEQVRNEHIAKLDGEIAKKDQQLTHLSDEIVKLSEQVREKDERFTEMLIENKRLQAAEEQAQDFVRQVEIQKQKIATLVKACDTCEKIQDEIELKKQICELNNKLSALEKEYDAHRSSYAQEKQELVQQIRNKEGHIDLLLESDRELERYKNTGAYRGMLRRQKMVDAILPPNSKRLFILRVLKKVITQPKLMARVIRPTYIKNYIKYLSQDSIEEITSRYNEIESVVKGEANMPQAALAADALATRSPKKELHIEDFDMLCFEQWEQPEVSIIIPVYNQFEYTYDCLKSILRNSGDVAYEVLIANDCSTDITSEIERVAKNVRLISTEQNVRFLLNCNNAAKYAKGKYIFFLNNDTQVKENWLQPLVDVMEKYADVGMVGSKLIYPDGRLQEAGGIVWKDASAWNYGHLKNPNDPEYTYLKEADYISGAAIMIRAELWEKIGGFDERYVPAYYEDTDLAFEVRKHGFKVILQPESVIVHFEGVSNGTDTSSGQKAYQVANHKKFYEKWKDVLQKEHFDNGENVYLAKDRGQTKKQILVVDHYVPNFDKDAGGRCTYMYLQMFLKLGLKVTFIGDNFARPEPYTTVLQQLGVEVLYGNHYYNNWKSWLKDNLQYFDYIYLQRPHISIKYIDLVKKYGKGKVFYFAHDLHHVRTMRDYELTGDVKALEESKKWKQIEMELFEKADVGHVVGSYEQSIMQKAFPDKPIRNIPLYIYPEEPRNIEKDFAKRKDLLFVGGFGHAPNVDAVVWFAQNIFPSILKKYPDIVWHVVGSKAPKEVTALASEHIVLDGFVSDEELAQMYRSFRMVVVPLRYGAGVKGKIVEAAYYQIPVVTTSIGGEGVDASVGAFVMEDDAEKMAQKICDLYEDYDALKKMSDAGMTLIQKYFTPEAAEAILLPDM